MDDNDPQNRIHEVANALSTMVALLCHELDKQGSLNKHTVADVLRRSADDAELTAPDHLKRRKRLDLMLMRLTADRMEEGPDSPDGQPPTWTPRIIEGGKTD